MRLLCLLYWRQISFDSAAVSKHGLPCAKTAQNISQETTGCLRLDVDNVCMRADILTRGQAQLELHGYHMRTGIYSIGDWNAHTVMEAEQATTVRLPEGPGQQVNDFETMQCARTSPRYGTVVIKIRACE
jgi:hypothetical protein